MINKYIGFALLLCLFMSCKSDDAIEVIDYTTQNEEEISAYVATNNLNAQRSSSGLYYVIDVEGDGVQPTTTSDVTIAYKGYFTNGTVFDESDAEGISYNLQKFIAGWTEGITYFKEGGSGILLVPSHLGYGAYTQFGIPGGSVLIFDIELISVN